MPLIVKGSEDRLLIKPSECYKREEINFSFSSEYIKASKGSLSHFIHYDNCKRACQITAMIL